LGTGITVNAIAPQARTRMNEFLFHDEPPAIDLDPDFVAELVSYLVSYQAPDISGHVLFVAGNFLREYVVSRSRHTPLIDHLRHVLPNLTE
jgi:NAD(P)-dependent dehydrogenase (short-subunit alcohol dehydrogenase family)